MQKWPVGTPPTADAAVGVPPTARWETGIFVFRQLFSVLCPGDSFGVVKYFVPILILRYFVELFFYGEKIRLMTDSKIMIPPRNKN